MAWKIRHIFGVFPGLLLAPPFWGGNIFIEKGPLGDVFSPYASAAKILASFPSGLWSLKAVL